LSFLVREGGSSLKTVLTQFEIRNSKFSRLPTYYLGLTPSLQPGTLNLKPLNPEPSARAVGVTPMLMQGSNFPPSNLLFIKFHMYIGTIAIMIYGTQCFLYQDAAGNWFRLRGQRANAHGLLVNM